jgi:hypothetical protein
MLERVERYVLTVLKSGFKGMTPLLKSVDILHNLRVTLSFLVDCQHSKQRIDLQDGELHDANFSD